MKKILGLDLGTNSIGWSLVEFENNGQASEIVGMGCRIIPMDAAILGEFDKGNSVSQTAERTNYRSTRKLYERHHQRRERLHRLLNILGFLPEHYKKEIHFADEVVNGKTQKKYGKFREEKEPKLVWKPTDKKENGKDKYEFLFQDLFKEMIEEFKKSKLQIFYTKKNGEECKIPYDWAIYYLRKKALTQKISKEQLAWLLLNFNQKRGYYQLRGEDEEVNENVKEFVTNLIISKVEKGEPDKKNDKRTWYKISFSNGWEYNATFTTKPNWENTEKEFLIVEEYDDNGNIKIVKDKKTDTTGKEKRRITPLPTFEEIDLMSKKDQDKIYGKIKSRTEVTINNSGRTVGAYIFDTLLQNPKQKINGKLVRTIERKFFKEELKKILEKQIELQPELFTNDLYNDCVLELYRSNDAHLQQLNSKNDFVHLFLNDIIFYQRPLKSQKSSIGNCTFEFKEYKKKDKESKEIEVKEYLKCIPKSNPYYQEFRIWQWLYNLKIYSKADDKDVTDQFIDSNEDREKLFEFLMSKKEVDLKDILKYFFSDKKANELKEEIAKYRWNYVYDSERDESKTYPMNLTGYEIRKQLEKVANVPDKFLTREIEQQLWHIVYSVNDKIEFETALETFARKHFLYYVPKSERDDKNPDKNCFRENFRKLVWTEKDYGSFSEKAIKKLLPLLRLGKYWSFDAIDEKTKTRIVNLQTAEVDENIKERVREKAINLTVNDHFQGLPLWLASYVVYNRYSEGNEKDKFGKTIQDLEKYLKEFKQHSLRNPIVEKVVTETLRVVKDIWQEFGKGAANFFDEIHIELGREMKNTAEDRERITKQVSENENSNLRIKMLLTELKNDTKIEGVREYSPMQQEILKIYEDGIINSGIEIPNDVSEIIKKFKESDTKKQPTKPEINRYKLWLEQKYRSPYTGEIIPLNKLFTSAYEIEHIIPQSRYFDDSFNNKVICEASVNKQKDNQFGLEFIKNHKGEIIETNFGKKVKLFTEDEYKNFVEEHYSKNRKKKVNLLLDEIPDKMITRQMNDTRYISKFVMQVLSNIVRETTNDDGVNSKNIIPGNGKITSTLKQDWGLNDVWNELILPRFERMNVLTNSQNFTSKNTNGKIIPTVPLLLSKGFQKKRIDHRHHALDALIIACATRDHVNLLNNQSAKTENSRFDLQTKLRNKEPWKDKYGKEREKFTEFKKPWENFTVDAKNKLEKIIVSFKQNLRVINKATNHYEKIEKGKKIKVEQKGVNWAIRKPMHKETVSGKVDLHWKKASKGKILTATRKSIDASFDLKKIETITDTGIQKILKNYLKDRGNNSELAFSPEGLDELNKNITKYNGNISHQPIFKVRIFEEGSKFQLGQKGNRKDKFVEAAKGTNLFFAIYQDANGKRSFETIPLNIVIERQKQGLNSVPEKNEKSNSLCPECPFLSPNDLVYVPTEEEKGSIYGIDFANLTKEQVNNIYKMVSSTGSECHFIHANISSLIKSYDAKSKIGEFGSLNKLETTMNNLFRIKEVCIKLKVDRLGNISKA